MGSRVILQKPSQATASEVLKTALETSLTMSGQS